jgi:hypothetical protein
MKTNGGVVIICDLVTEWKQVINFALSHLHPAQKWKECGDSLGATEDKADKRKTRTTFRFLHGRRGNIDSTYITYLPQTLGQYLKSSRLVVCYRSTTPKIMYWGHQMYP